MANISSINTIVARKNPSKVLLPPNYKASEPVVIEGYYMMWDANYSRFTIAKCLSRDIAYEIAVFYLGRGAVYYDVYQSCDDSIYACVEKLNQAGIGHGYISVYGDVVEYKTRVEIIDELLSEI